MANSLADLAINLTANIAGFTSDLGRAQREADKRTKAIAKSFTQLGAAIVGAVSVRALTSFAKSSIDAADNLRDLSQQFGVSVNRLSQYKVIAEQSGTSIQALAAGFKSLSKQATEGSVALQAMGIEAKDSGGKVKDYDLLMGEIADKFAGYKDGAEKAALAQELFGKAGAQLIPLLNEGSAGINKMREAADKLGITIDDQLADASDEFNDNLVLLQGSVQGLANNLLKDLLPGINSIVGSYIEYSKESDAAEKVTSALAVTIKGIIAAFVIAKNTLDNFVDSVFFTADIIGAASNQFKTFGIAVKDAFSVNVKLLSGDFQGAFEAIKEGSVNAAEGTKQSIDQVKNSWEALKSGFANNTADVEDSLLALFHPLENIDEQMKKTKASAGALPPSVKKVGDAMKEAAAQAEKMREVMSKQKDEMREYNEEVKKAAQELMEMLNPLKGVEEEYKRNKAVIEEAIYLRERENKSTNDLERALVQLEKRRNEEAQAIKDELNPINKLIEELKFEAEVSKLGNIERQREIMLRHAHASATAEQVRAIDELIKQSELANNQGLFGAAFDAEGLAQPLDTFEDLLGASIDSAFKDGIRSGLDILRNGISAAFKDAKTSAESISGIANFAADAASQFRQNPDAPLRALTAIATKIPGIVGSIASAVSAVDSLFGGRLLGTNYQRQSSTSGFAIGPGGATGSTSMTETRQRALFGGTARRTTTSQLDAQAMSDINKFYEQLKKSIAEAGRMLGVESGDLIAGSFKQEFDKNGNLVKQFSSVMGRTFNESIEEFQKRITGENLISVLQKSLGASSEINSIVEAWRGNASKLLEGAQMLLVVQTSIKQGVELFGSSLSETAELVQRLTQAGETLSETYIRLNQSTELLERALSLTNNSLDLTREQFIVFAADITDSAGGLQRAQELWQSYFETFYSASENVSNAITRARETASELLANVGITDSTSVSSFRAAFEAALPSLSGEEVAEWLRAGEALSQLIAAQSQLTSARNEEITAANELAQLMDSLANESTTEFAQDLADINSRMREVAQQANDLAIAAGRAGASQEELAQITTWAARQYGMAVDRLKDRVQSLANELYGSQLDNINSQIDALQSSSEDAATSVQDLGEANRQRYEQELSYIESIQQFVDSLMLSDLSPLNPQQKFNEAQTQFADLLSRSRGGDLEALGQLQGAAQTLLEQGRSFLGPSDEFTRLFDDVTSQLSGLTPGADPGYGGGGGVVGAVSVVPSAELEELFARREAILLEQEQANRNALAENLAVQIGELSIATRQSAIDLAEEMGINLQSLVTDLGISLDNLSVDTARELADVARTLNLSVSDLANAVGVSLGELTETNSLLNDAFEAELSRLPQEIQDELFPLLRAVESAVGEADANSAINALRNNVSNLAPEFANSLAGFLNLDYSIAEPLASLEDVITEYSEEQIDLLEQINDALGRIATNTAPAEPPSVGDAGMNPAPGSIDPSIPPSAPFSPEPGGGTIGNLISQLIVEVKNAGNKQAQATVLAAEKMMSGRGR